MPVPLNTVKLNQKFNINSINADCEDTMNHLLQVGIYEGMEVSVVNCAPIFKDPITIKVNNRLIGIRKAMASKIMVKAAN